MKNIRLCSWMVGRVAFSAPTQILLGLGLSAALGAAPALAHHSFRAYDMSKTVTVSATIKEFRWGAPHSSLIVMYQDAKGKTSSMSLGSGSPMVFIKQGFQPRDFHTGDKVKIAYHPNVSGLPGGFMSKLTTADGRSYSDSEAAAAPAGPPKS
ncbi:hypothetical protein WSK_2306 [Novosphingobium sp. Rr 2-17]|uniref:DUF6152 family protein n=1 Tax=Novosphingobium sp. Rr 2-17 TaxID=555793 RepID=UPI0002699EC7|nr:DUF6152 family protein [Novosphingobium sp. Rr 2-17]EIZ79119.1 hypothetical protein WSK_2306 [Novosphingobium sp. Rr 2-17]